MIVKPYPKDNEARTFGVREQWLDAIAEHISELASRERRASRPKPGRQSRATPSERVWVPAVKASGLDFNVRMHDLRHAHASWLLAGGADLKGVMKGWGTRRSRRQKYLHTLSDTDRTSTLSPALQVDGQDCRAPAEIFGGLPLAAQATGRSDSTY